jgi:hypothetical protein
MSHLGLKACDVGVASLLVFGPVGGNRLEDVVDGIQDLPIRAIRVRGQVSPSH